MKSHEPYLATMRHDVCAPRCPDVQNPSAKDLKEISKHDTEVEFEQMRSTLCDTLL